MELLKFKMATAGFLFYLIANISPHTQKEKDKGRKNKEYLNKSNNEGNNTPSSTWFLVTPNCLDQTIVKHSVSSHISLFLGAI